ncbi:hypothetical protein PR003_g14755 [Phytophthora rubi]|uniref:Uncharacterized protein n=1 Tax=Phytophthora rubi TaxID=129364 RepID=A0A6A4EYF3_9STRA|nr:hypothetical protein PR003_g14755 [Phytophthora rubi]
MDSDVNAGSRDDGIGDGVILEDVEASSVFLTGVPSTSSSLITTGTTETGSDKSSSRRRSSVITDGGDTGFEAPEDDDNNNNDEDDGFASFGFSASRQAAVQTPGLKRRKRLADLHQFVSTQLQKRLFKSWDTIEIAFTGSGEMTVSQIVKFLQLSDVQLGDKDAAKVQKILEEHVAIMQAAQDTQPGGDGGAGHTLPNQKRGKAKAVLSYEGFRQIFHPVDVQEASKWKREFDREKFRQRQEKDIYSKELAALEEKVRQRLANSARQMVEILQQFKCDPNTIPWENEQQRLQLRSQFFEVIFQQKHNLIISASNTDKLTTGVLNSVYRCIQLITNKTAHRLPAGVFQCPDTRHPKTEEHHD